MNILNTITSILLVPYFVTVIIVAAGTTVILLLFWLLRHFWNYCYNPAIESPTRQTLVILGTGWGSYRTLLDINVDRYNIVVISLRNHFLFTPLLCSTAVGTLESRSAVEPLYSVSFGSRYRFILGEVTDVDFKARKVHCHCLHTGNDISISFDRLVIGVGAITNTYGVTGVEEHSLFLKEAVDAVKVRNKVSANIQQALQADVDEDTRRQLLHFVIVGGGPTGVELSAELLDFLLQDARPLFGSIISESKITIIERSGILASFHPKLQKYAKDQIEKRVNLEVIRSTVTKVLLNGVLLQDGCFIRCGLIVWCGGIAQRPLTTALALPKNAKGQILVDKRLTVTDENLKHRVYALGDCAQVVNNPLPCTAQVAFQQGCYLAQLLNKSSSANFEIFLIDYPPFSFKSLGTMAYIGNYKAIANLEALPVAIQLTGFPAFVLWRVAYLYRLSSWRQRLQVPVDWLKTAFFGRDVSEIH